ncbi:helix-turn-helix domain-containing protein [Dyadobacter aurulentus]|uniref:helix-turn-helix domain-containing protein n=1 Tax=Dyadobacter sp. UC 10 TaxID=2605428 RepID=UPI0011F143D7|nr:XRE family transcriptional regulator [Dyadobacter sp. UC 10]KAA0991960.1 helix-turn-helix domain-containing protein [Dyadobacter sp. UC 10]
MWARAIFCYSCNMGGFFILEVGRRIKEKRLDKRMTLQELADKSGVSKGLVSQIENGRTIPSLPVMLGIIQSLEIEVSEFFQGLSLLEPTILVNRRKDYAPFQKEDAKGFNYSRMMMRNLPASTIDFALLELTTESYREEVTTDAYEFIYIIKGQTECRVNGQTMVLEEGDSIFFDGRLPHVPKNTSDSNCLLLVLYFFDQNS